MADDAKSAPPVRGLKTEDIDAAVAAWVDAKLRNSVVARNTEVWNYLVGVLPDLTAFIAGK